MLSAGREISYKSVKIDDLDLTQLDLLKIDVEGFEVKVLQGALQTITKLKPKIIIETHSLKLRAACHEILQSLGYVLKKEGRTIYNTSREMDQVTNLFYAVP